MAGTGTVGREVVRFLLDHQSWPQTGMPTPSLVGVGVRDLERAVARGIPAEFARPVDLHLLDTPSLGVLVELLGGDEPAHGLIGAALRRGISVVTANKLVLARYGYELEAAARASGATLRFEAAVGGGIPVLSPMASDLVANAVQTVRGIVNGTTNYLITEMSRGGRPFEAVLSEAQRLGYAESDPTADVRGADAVNKIVILARLGFNVWLDSHTVSEANPSAVGLALPGLLDLTPADLESAGSLGYQIRLVASAKRMSGGVAASVNLVAVPARSSLGSTDGVTNRIEVTAAPVGTVAFEGPGAGGPATSSAVLADLNAISLGGPSTWGSRPAATPGESRTEKDSLRSWLLTLPPATAIEGSWISRGKDPPQRSCLADRAPDS